MSSELDRGEPSFPHPDEILGDDGFLEDGDEQITLTFDRFEWELIEHAVSAEHAGDNPEYGAIWFKIYKALGSA